MTPDEVADELDIDEVQVFIRACRMFGTNTDKPLYDCQRWLMYGSIPGYVISYCNYVAKKVNGD